MSSHAHTQVRASFTSFFRARVVLVEDRDAQLARWSAPPMNKLSLLALAPFVFVVPRVHADGPLYRDASAPIDARVADLLAQMTLDEKIGQMTQAAIDFAKPNDVRNAQLGSVLS